MEEETVATELRHAEFSQQSIRKTIDELQNKASSVLLFTLQWKDLEEHFVRIRDSIESGATQVQSIKDSLNVAQESIDSRLRGVEAKEKELERIKEALEERFREIEVLEREIDLKQMRDSEECERDMKERVRMFEVKEKEFEDRVRDFEFKQKRFEERNILHERKEKQFEKRLKELEPKEKQFEKRSKELESKEKQFEKQCKDLELKERQFEKGVKAFKGNEEKNGESKSKRRKFADSQHYRVKIQSPGPGHRDTNSVDDSMDANLYFCVTMDGKALQIFLNERWKEHDVMRSEVFLALQKSSNPAKLVLDAIQGFYPPHFKKEDSEFEGHVVMQSCILLLEQLMKISPPISPNVRKEAMQLAFDWITKMRVDVEHSLQVLGFLLLLASYRLASAFDSDELLSYMEILAQHSQVPQLLHTLGLEDKTHGFIQNLIYKEQILLAVRFIYALELVDEFPPVPLLRKFLDTYEKLSRNSNSKDHVTLEEQSEATKRRLTDLKSLVKCIEEYKLESEFSFKSLEASVTLLDEEIKRGEPAVPNLGNNAQIHLPEEEICMTPTPAPEAASTSASTLVLSQTISPASAHISKALLQPQGSSNCPRTVDTDEDPLNLIGSTVFSVPSVQTTSQPPTILSIGEDPSHLKIVPCNSESESSLAFSAPASQPDPNYFHVDFDGKGLKLILSKHENDDLARDKVYAALQHSANPAKLVLDAVKGEGFKLGVSKEDCILLLEQLRKLSPLIKPHVKEEALEFVNSWKEKLLKQDQLEVVCVLQFLATYGLASSVNGNELLRLLGIGFWVKMGPNLHKVLGLADMAENYIRSLIGKNRRLLAIKVIHAVEMIDKFPLVPLLKDHLIYIKNKAEIPCKKKKTAGVINYLISQLRGVMECILHLKLESQISVKSIEEQIRQLEEQKAKELEELEESNSKLKREVSAKSESVQKKHKQQQSTVSSTAPVVSATSGPPSVTASTFSNSPKMRRKKYKKSKFSRQTQSQHSQLPAGRSPRQPHQWPTVAAPPHHYRDPAVAAPPHQYHHPAVAAPQHHYHHPGPFGYAGAPHWEISAIPYNFQANAPPGNVRPPCHQNVMGVPGPDMHMPFGRF